MVCVAVAMDGFGQGLPQRRPNSASFTRPSNAPVSWSGMNILKFDRARLARRARDPDTSVVICPNERILLIRKMLDKRDKH